MPSTDLSTRVPRDVRTPLVLVLFGILLVATVAVGFVRGAQADTVRAVQLQDKQRVTLPPDGDAFPRRIEVRGGRPTEFLIAPGGDSDQIEFTDLGLSIPFGSGGAALTVPALERGTYRYRCNHDELVGTLVVQ